MPCVCLSVCLFGFPQFTVLKNIPEGPGERGSDPVDRELGVVPLKCLTRALAWPCRAPEARDTVQANWTGSLRPHLHAL